MCGEMFLADIRIRGTFRLRNVDWGLRIEVQSEIRNSKSEIGSGRKNESGPQNSNSDCKTWLGWT